MEPYKYETLPANHVRMLMLSAGLPDSPLCGSLENFDMTNAADESYEPLSYVWGAPNFEHEFTCDGKTLQITNSLYQALSRLRLPDQDRRLWADQICINQEDLDERGNQVQFMNSIYKHANRVLVWLGGDENGNALSAFRMAESLASTFADKERYEKFRVDHSTENLHLRSEEEWTPIKKLTHLPWFERVWIIQEIGTKAPATLFWGNEASIDWHLLYGVCEKLTDFHHLRRQFDIDTAKIKFVYQRFVPPDLSTRHANRLSFIYELHRARHVKATDHRDRIFAFLGHYSVTEGKSRELRSLTANYDKVQGTLPKVYADAATRALLSGRGLGMGGVDAGLIALAAVQHEEELPSSYAKWDKVQRDMGESYVPSWVPDWRTYTSHILSEPTSPHRAASARGGRYSEPVLRVKNSRVLYIKGAVIDVITHASKPLKSKAFHKPGKPSLVDRLWQEVCEQEIGPDQILFDLSRQYREGQSEAEMGRCSAFLAYMQTLSNGGAATALRRYDRISDGEWLGEAAAYLFRALGGESQLGNDSRPVSPDSPDEDWSRSANGAATNRVFARTASGYYLLGPKVLAEGDQLCVLWGGKVCFCLRPLDEEGTRHLLVGECYAHGLMNGQVEGLLKRNVVQEKEFVIV
ncbi:heterokaryon incompatibility protein-domain-containing protein [Rhypophila decipiens]|uniref:Heterokaryon incompatibility protein-domain-containing protein n=1 Tax=Rhypophila decipiens TaxID=261697 RepID=A0AAN6Y0V9_9PEZI|nr:heterokaryon incompatibility protein-domain-containing protein [Rhypophila decipiens]